MVFGSFPGFDIIRRYSLYSGTAVALLLVTFFSSDELDEVTDLAALSMAEWAPVGMMFSYGRCW